MTAPQATLGRTPQHQFDVSIGCLPLRLRIPEEPLRAAASARYSAFTASHAHPFTISCNDSVAASNSDPEFSCTFGNAVLKIFASESSFAGVGNEYALDGLLRMFLSWRLLPHTGFLLHAATVVRNGRAFVFTGRSGAGKSTVASLAPAGSVLTDEISLLRFEDGVWRAYGTPFWGEFRAAGSNVSAPVAGIFRLLQSATNQVASLHPMEFLRILLPNILFFSSDLAANQRLLEILGQAVQQISGYTLDFRRDATFWEALPA
ncbi:MAG TPA: hypothetical protein VGI16_08900 [Candidatus Acidoferrum sp.]